MAFRHSLLLLALSLSASAYADATPLTKPEKSASCPSGYSSSGNYCNPTSKTAKPGFVKKKKSDSCPSGYHGSGWFCVKS